MDRKTEILLIDDDEDFATILQERLTTGTAWKVFHLDDPRKGLKFALEKDFDLVICDYRMPDMSGIDVVRLVAARKPRMPVILMTAHDTGRLAVESIKNGACDYVPKTGGLDKIKQAVEEVLQRSLATDSETATLSDVPETGEFIAASETMREVFKEVGRIAGHSVNVLIRGETGTGKEVVARTIHQHGSRPESPFLAINCAAIPETLLESELFGHEKGAFTGAAYTKIGRFEQAREGTLFLDEIGDMSMNTQVKLLRVLQEKSIQRLGGDGRDIRVNTRVIAATHQNLEKMIQEGKFREDLFYRLNIAVIRIPPLRERREEIPFFVSFFLNRASTEFGLDMPSITREAMDHLVSYDWPGNVRQLQNLVTQLVLRLHAQAITKADVERLLGRPQGGAGEPGATASGLTMAAYVARRLQDISRQNRTNAYAEILGPFEYELLFQCMELAKGNQTRVTKWLGLSRPTLREKLIRYGLYEMYRGKTDPEEPVMAETTD